MRMVLGVALALLFCSSAFASDQNPCEQSLTSGSSSKSQILVIPSPRVPEDAKLYSDYALYLTKPGGVLDKLGIEITGQVIEFLPPNDLNAFLAGSLGGYPVRHFLDGAEVLRSQRPSGGFALEVVFPGPFYQHGFYRDDNRRFQQISIIDHVIGHNIFAKHSVLPHYRHAQGLESTRRADDILKLAYERFPHAKVSRDFLFLQTLQIFDTFNPVWETPEDFEPKAEPDVEFKLLSDSFYSQFGDQKPKKSLSPAIPTENVAQFLAYDLKSSSAPDYKKELLAALIDAGAFRPALVHTQIMNEGLATRMQEIIPKHSEHNTFEFWADAHQVISGTEGQPNFRDPYSFGVFGWRHLWQRELKNNPHLKSLSQDEQDRKEIEFLTDYISKFTDEHWIRDVVDAEFTSRFNLAVVRPASDSEQDPNLQPPKGRPGEPPPVQWIIESREPEKVAQRLIETVLHPKFMYRPRVRVMNQVRPVTGELELVVDDAMGRRVALDSTSIAPSLFAIASFREKPVSLECTVKSQSAGGEVVFTDLFESLEDYQKDWLRDRIKAMGPEAAANAFPDYLVFKQGVVRARFSMSPEGEFKAFRILDERLSEFDVVDTAYIRDRRFVEKEDQELFQATAPYLREYIETLYLEDQKELTDMVSKSLALSGMGEKWMNTTKTVPGGPIGASSDLGLQSPNASGALMAYYNYVAVRMGAAILRAQKLKRGLVASANGNMRVQVLPPVVNLQFDNQSLSEFINSDARVLKEDFPQVGMLFQERAFDPIDNLVHLAKRQVGGVRGRTGDRFWGPGRPKGGQGAKGRKPGEDPEDPTFVEIDKELWSEFLNERVKLPILNPKPGEVPTPSTRKGGRRLKSSGEMRVIPTMNNILKAGLGEELAKGGSAEVGTLDPFDLFESGFKAFNPKNTVVKSRVPKVVFEKKAVVTFILDRSGSTQHYYESFKRFVNDVEALIRKHYQGFRFEYIVFDSEAQRLASREEFFSVQLGGGTRYASGFKKALEVYRKDYPIDEQDRYTFVMGDTEDFEADIQPVIDEIVAESDFMGLVAGMYQPSTKLLESFQSLRDSTNKVGVTILNQDGTYSIDNIREVLRDETSY